MFNRNLNGNQFPDLDLDAPVTSQSVGAVPSRAKGTPVPLAGGTFTPHEDVQLQKAAHPGLREHTPEGSYPGTFITQSAQTVIPGEASWGYYEGADTPYVSFESTGEREENRGMREPGKGPDWYVSSGFRADPPLGAHVTGRYGANPETGRSHTGLNVPFEKVGAHIRSKRKDLE